MASAPASPGDAPRQLWLDVARPIQPRPERERRISGRAAPSPPSASPQMELRMVAAPAEPPAQSAAHREIVAKVRAPQTAEPSKAENACFVTWLREQGKKAGAIGELAKAARLDPLFPRKGSADDVRARFGRAGADGDAFAALDDAERDYDRLARL